MINIHHFLIQPLVLFLTHILLAFFIVKSLCAITIIILSFMYLFIFFKILFWDILSSADVASSKIIILLLLIIALAIWIRCFWPPDILTAFSPITVSIQFSKDFNRSPRPTTEVILHSDLGSQYKSTKFKEFVNKNKIIHSFSGKGNPYDNACIESFHASLKKEEVNLVSYSLWLWYPKASHIWIYWILVQ